MYIALRAAARVPGTMKSRQANIIKAKEYEGKHRASNRAYLDCYQTFDHLVMTELRDAEREQENNGYRLTEKDFVKRFVKHLILLSLGMNSFWAIVAVMRVICNYAAEALDFVYPIVAPNRAEDGVKDKTQCSRIRGKFLEFAGARFGVCPENLFTEDDPQVYSSSDWRVRTVKECIERFRPLGGLTVPEPYTGKPNPLIPYEMNDPRGDERIEVDRMAILFSPADFNRIVASAGLRPFEESIRRLNFKSMQRQARRKSYAE